MKNDKFEFDISNFDRLHSVVNDLSNILAKAEELSLTNILSKICVSPPYFAFKKIYQFDDVLIAPITQEQPIGFESTPMSSAEASRHLAILGSCALAINQNDHQYYLAVRARKRAGGDDAVNKNVRSDQLYVLATSIFHDGKEAAAATILVNSKGDVIFNFMVGYQVFPDKLFDRLFKKHSQPTEKINRSPYREAFGFKDIVINDNILKATLPVMQVEQCAGHFHNFPILPIGVLAYMSISTIGNFLNKITKNPNFKYHLLNAEMDVFTLTSINEEAELIVNYLGHKDNQYNFSWAMNSGLPLKKNLNTMNISFAIEHDVHAVYPQTASSPSLINYGTTCCLVVI